RLPYAAGPGGRVRRVDEAGVDFAAGDVVERLPDVLGEHDPGLEPLPETEGPEAFCRVLAGGNGLGVADHDPGQAGREQVRGRVGPGPRRRAGPGGGSARPWSAPNSRVGPLARPRPARRPGRPPGRAGGGRGPPSVPRPRPWWCRAWTRRAGGGPRPPDQGPDGQPAARSVRSRRSPSRVAGGRSSARRRDPRGDRLADLAGRGHAPQVAREKLPLLDLL